MIDLEWLRTFRAVYRTKSLSRAAELLNISQPTISQQLSTLEKHIGQKLFTRKSKGVIETDDGRILNTLISGSIESLEEVENLIKQKTSKLKTIITIGISSHLYKTMLCHKIVELGPYVHIKFGPKQELITEVEEGRLLYAIIPDEINTFDTLCYPLFDHKLVLLSTPDIDLDDLKKIYKKDCYKAERLLTDQVWYAHDTSSSYIKLYWIHVFNKRRPAIVPNYVIPNEFETLYQLSKGSGLSIALDANAEPFLKKGILKKWDLTSIFFRKLSLIANKKRSSDDMTNRVLDMLTRTLSKKP